MKDLVKAQLATTGVTDTSCVDAPFDHMTREISEQSV
jgi:phycobilisome core component